MRPEIKLMSQKDMVSEYNALTGKAIEKFSSRAAGEKQLVAARAAGKVPEPSTGSPLRAAQTAKAEKTPCAPKAGRNAATAASWKDPAIAAKRAERSRVRVDGKEHRSVGAAFLALSLPMKACIPFRMALKDSGRKTYAHDGKSYVFTLVES